MGREGLGYISPDVQREAIERWAAYRGVTIAEWHVDEDQSGGTQNRPGLREAMRRIEAGDTGGLACWRLNRFARNVAAAIGDVQTIQAADAQLVCVEEDIDTTAGPFGSFMLTILLAVATLERDNLMASWETAKMRALQRGAPIGPTPFGYERTAEGTLQPHPDQAPVVTRAFELAASAGPQGALAYLREHAPERTWSTFTLRRFLAARSYLGEIHYGDQVVTDSHTPLVTRAVWTAAQVAEGQRRRRAADFPLSALAKCATCGEGMIGGRAGGSRGRTAVRTYSCRASLTSFKGTRCPTPATVNADTLEDYVRDQLGGVLADLRVTVGEPDTDIADLESALEAAESELSDFAADLTLRRALGDRYTSHRDSRVAAVDAAREAYENAARTTTSKEIAAADLDASGNLEGLARAVLSGVTVKPGRGNVPERVKLNEL
jgi:DNA invertase Pin-like site-specific DNA recombinase